MRSALHALAESVSFNSVIDMDHAFGAMQRMHNWWGIVTVGATLLHVWSILFPAVTDGYSIEVASGTFEWPLSERKPKGFKDISGPEEKRIMLQIDDVWRLVEMTILLAVLLPLSYQWLKTKYHVGIHLHNFIAAMYVVDIVRRHTHPHNWFLNPPIVLLWLVDRFIFGHWWRCQTPKIFRLQLSPDYMLLCWNQRRILDTVSPEFFLRLVDSGWLERAHVVSGFQRKLALLALPGVPTDSIGHHWTSAAIVRVYHNPRSPVLPAMDRVSHTHRMAGPTEANPLYIWGPFTSDMSRQLHAALLDDGVRPLCLVGSGSAVCYLLDAVQVYLSLGSRSSRQLHVLYTCRDAELFRYVTRVFERILCAAGTGAKGLLTNLIIHLGLTDDGGRLKAQNSNVYAEELDASKERLQAGAPQLFKKAVANASNVNAFAAKLHGKVEASKTAAQDEKLGVAPRGAGVDLLVSVLKLAYGRLSFADVMPKEALVYVQGSGSLQRMVAKAATQLGCKLVSGPAYDVTTTKPAQHNSTSILHRCLPLPCCLRAAANGTRILPSDLGIRTAAGSDIARNPTQAQVEGTAAGGTGAALSVEDIEDEPGEAVSPVPSGLIQRVERVARFSKEAMLGRTDGVGDEAPLYFSDASPTRMSRATRASKERIAAGLAEIEASQGAAPRASSMSMPVLPETNVDDNEQVDALLAELDDDE